MIAIFSAHPDFTNIQQISEGANNNANSIQRNNDGTYSVGSPTPRLLNDGGGEVFNGISISTNQTQYHEGDVFDIVFTAQQNVAEDVTFSITDRKSTRLNSSHVRISYAVFCLKKKK